MIVSLEGKLVETGALSAVVEIGGIGYLVSIPLTVSCKLPPIGQNVKFNIYAVYRDDRQDLYGFLSKEERDFFKLIVEKVSGIGPRTTLNIMSKLSLTALKEAISGGNPEILAKCHGIGKKSAERIIIELSDKDIATISTKSTPGLSKSNSNINDAIAALSSLGYKLLDAEKVVKKAIDRLGENPSTEEIIRAALN